MTLIEELREQLSGAPRNQATGIDEMTDYFRQTCSALDHTSHIETHSAGIRFEDRTSPDVQLELEARDVARQWIEARRHQGFLSN